MSEGKYRPERKFGMPEDQDVEYLDNQGKPISKDEWLEMIRKEAEASRKAGYSTRSETRVMKPLPGES